MINPQGLTATQWADAVQLECARFGTVSTLIDPADWRAWAQSINNLPGIAGQTPPDPYQCDEWFDYAERFNLVSVLGD